MINLVSLPVRAITHKTLHHHTLSIATLQLARMGTYVVAGNPRRVTLPTGAAKNVPLPWLAPVGKVSVLRPQKSCV